MKLFGLQKTTLLDYPDHLAAVVFTGGCNFRCPFCHNSELLDGQMEGTYTHQQVLEFLNKRRGILEGVCITGGEPTLQPDLEPFIRSIRELGFLVKLDTNGYRPDVLKSLCSGNLLDYVAMDIKASRERYGAVSGLPSLQVTQIEKSLRFLLEGSVPYELRTTAVKGLHTADDFEQIGPWITGCQRYYIQNYTDSPQVLVPGAYSGFTRDELASFADMVRPYVSQVHLRGVSDVF